ncbi:hypothetical protein BJG92_03525 [Arthrobacter sp. SO5]|nr:hypothetical protein [Arthrobacter sp. SO5]
MSSAVGYAMNGERAHRRRGRGGQVFVAPGFVLENHVRTVSAAVSPCAGSGIAYLGDFRGIWMVAASQKRGVHNVQTLGFGSGHTGAGRAGLSMFAGEWRIFNAWSPVRVPPRARAFPVQGLLVLWVWTNVHLWAPSGVFLVGDGCCGRVDPFLGGRRFGPLLLLHGCLRRLLHDAVDLGGAVLWGAECDLAGTSHPFMACVLENDMTGWGIPWCLWSVRCQVRVAGQSTRGRPTAFLIRCEPFRQPVTELGWFD